MPTSCRARSLLKAAAIAALGVAALAPTGARADDNRTGGRAFRQLKIGAVGHQIAVRDYPGREPAVVLMHGFPDSMHLYDRVVPLLRGRRTVTFDFLGWGQSDKPSGRKYTFDRQVEELDAVVRGLHLRRPVLVPHDASGPAAIDWALAHPENTGALGLLNTFYDLNPDLKPPQAIALWSGLLDLRATPNGPSGADYLAPLREELARNRAFERELYFWQLGRFITTSSDRKSVIPALWREFCCQAHGSATAFRSITQDVVPTVVREVGRVPLLRSLDVPVRVIWGRNDPYLTTGLARRFAADFPRTDLHLLDARHYVQVDKPREVANLLRTLAVKR